MTDAASLAAERAAGLRALADLIEATPEIDANYLDGSSSFSAWYVWQPEDLATIARAGLAHGAKVDKSATGDIFTLRLEFGPIHVNALSNRAAVCERVVVVTEIVTETVKDPDALAKVPEVEVTEEREIVEWRCAPLLEAGAS